jgi:hypothetical protein
MTRTFRVSPKMAANERRLDEVSKKVSASPILFLEFRQTAVVRRATGGRTSYNSGAAAARCAEGDRREPFAQRFAATRSWRFRSTKLSATTKLDTKHKASFNH